MADKAVFAVTLVLAAALGLLSSELEWWLTLCGLAAIFAFSVAGYSVISAVTEIEG